MCNAIIALRSVLRCFELYLPIALEDSVKFIIHKAATEN